MREGLARRWIGLHVVVFVARGLLIGPAWTFWGSSHQAGWIWAHALLTWIPVSYVQTRVPDRFPAPFRWWGAATATGFLLGYWAAWSAYLFCFSTCGVWIDAHGLSPAAVSFVAAFVSYGFVFPLPQAAVLLWKVRHASIWLWVAAVAGAQMLMAPLGVLESFALGDWKRDPIEASCSLLLLGAAHGALLGLATLKPLRRLQRESGA